MVFHEPLQPNHIKAICIAGKQGEMAWEEEEEEEEEQEREIKENMLWDKGGILFVRTMKQQQWMNENETSNKD